MLIYLAGSAIGQHIPEILGWLMATSLFVVFLFKGKKILCGLLQIFYYCFIKKGYSYYQA